MMQQSDQRERESRGPLSSGFTLIELLAVMTIMMILSGIAIVGYRGFIGSTAMTTAIQQMRQTLQLARQTAIVNGRDVYVVFWQNPAVQSNWYTTCMLHGTVTDGSGNQLVDRFNPDLQQAVYIDSEIFNLSSPSCSVSRVTGITNLTLTIDGEVISNVCQITTSGVNWQSGDSYGLEARRRMRMPRGFLFMSVPRTLRFKPTGEAEPVDGTPPWQISFYEAVKGTNRATLQVSMSGFVTISY